MTTPTAIAPNGWYGPAAPLADKPRLLGELRAARAPEEYLAASLELFKIGDFTSTSILFDLMGEVRDPGFAASALRVLQSVCTHDDLRRPENLTVLAGGEASVVQTFASGVLDTQSWEMAPYLLALADDWSGHHEVEDALRFGLDELSDYTSVLPDDAPLADIGEHVERRRSELDPERYYLGTELSFPGILTTSLARAAMSSTSSGARLGLAVEPSLLSIWSGVLCPVDASTPMDDGSVGAALAYIDHLLHQEWTPGAKYFYGHRVG